MIAQYCTVFIGTFVLDLVSRKLKAMIHGVLMILVRFSLLATLQFLMIALPVLLDLLEFLWTLSSNFCTFGALAMMLAPACLGLAGV